MNETNVEQYNPEEVGKLFDKKWWGRDDVFPNLYVDLIEKVKDINYQVSFEPPTLINRLAIACNYLKNTLPKGAKVLDIACGNGLSSNCLMTLGFDVKAFDVASVAIEKSQDLARQLGHDPANFAVRNVGDMADLASQSYDAVVAIGLFRYLDAETADLAYKSIHRVLKPEGKFLVVHTNILFDAFSLNNESLKFWADIIEGYTVGASTLLNGKTTLEALTEDIKVPERKFVKHSISSEIKVNSENPLTYHEVASKYSFSLDKIVYPPGHILPPFLEGKVDKTALSEMKRQTRLEKTEDWRAIFTEYEFLAYLTKK